MNIIGWDIGRPSGDHTTLAVKCPSCVLLHTLSWPHSPIGMMPIFLDCPCGVYTDLRQLPDSAAPQVSTLCAVCDQIKELHPNTHPWTPRASAGEKS